MSEVICISSDSESYSDFEEEMVEAKRRSLLDTNIHDWVMFIIFISKPFFLKPFEVSSLLNQAC